jgi:hypothetical protein
MNAMKPSNPIDNAVADMKRQLRGESKSNLIRQWIGLYAQVIQLGQENSRLKQLMSANTNTEAGALEEKSDEK